MADGAVPFVGVDAFARARRRTAIVRLVLGVAALALLAAAVLAAHGLQAPPQGILPQGRSGVVVLDLSRSIGIGPAQEARHALERLDSPSQRLGLVVFSDIAYELFPPGSPGVELRPVLRFFTPLPGGKNQEPTLPVSPWDDSFRAGTQISVGLREGWTALKRAHARNGTILLVSDLATEPDDLQYLVPLVVSLRQHGVQLKILALNPSQSNYNLFARLAGNDAFVSDAPSLGLGGILQDLRAAVTKPLPWALLACAAVLLLALGANELLCGRLTVPEQAA